MFSDLIYFMASVPSAGFEITERKPKVPAGARANRLHFTFGTDINTPHMSVFTEMRVNQEGHDDLILQPARGTTGFRRVCPDEERPGLFRDIAGMAGAGPEEFKEIANLYGNMSSTEDYSEPVGEWSDGAKTLAFVVELADLLDAGDRDKLASLFRWGVRDGDPNGHAGPMWWIWTDDRPVICPPPPGTPLATTVEGGVWFPVPFSLAGPATDVRLLTDVFLQFCVNLELSNGTTTRIESNWKTGRRELRVSPKNLSGVLWLQFARALSGNKRFQKCKECPTHFEVLAKSRGRKEFCSVACKLKDYRRRKALGQVAPEVEPDAPAKRPGKRTNTTKRGG